MAGEQSSRAFGWIYSNGWDLGKLELANRSKTLWQGFAARFGENIGFRQSGNVTLMGSDEEVGMYGVWLKSALEIQPQMDARIDTGADLDTLVPGAGSRFKAALYQASDGTAEPTDSVSRSARAARSPACIPRKATSRPGTSSWQAAPGVRCSPEISACACRN